jgi:peptide/nickel transport system substrate-binding protein
MGGGVSMLGKKLAGALLVASAFAALGTAAGSAARIAKVSSTTSLSKAAGPVKGGTLTIAYAAEPTTLDPTAGQTDAGAQQFQIQIFDQLVEEMPGQSAPVPGLAKSWSISADQLTYTFHLRKARFSTGAPVTAADVLFSFKLIANSKHDSGFAGLFSNVKSITAPNPETVVFHLSKRTPALLGYLSFNVASVVPKSVYLREGAQKFARAPVGSGAFRLVRWVSGQELDLARNPFYWHSGRPYLDKVNVQFISDDLTRVLDLKSGSVDIADRLPYTQISQFKDSPNFRTLVKRVAIADLVYFDEKFAPLQDKNVRLALNYATPKAEISDAITGGAGTVANSLMMATRFWDPSIKPIPFDIAKAKAALAASSVPNGFTLNLGYDGASQPAKQIATILQSAWGQIGVHVVLQSTDVTSLGNNLFGGKLAAGVFEYASSDVADDDEMWALFGLNLGPNNLGWHLAPALTQAIKQATSGSESPAVRKREWSRIQAASLQDPQAVPLFFPPTSIAMKNTVHGLNVTITNWWRLDNVWLG